LAFLSNHAVRSRSIMVDADQLFVHIGVTDCRWSVVVSTHAD